MRLGLSILFQSQQRGTQIVLYPRIVRAPAVRAGQVTDRIREPRLIEANDTQQMQRIEMQRIMRDQLKTAALDLCIVSRTIIAHCRLHPRARRWRGPFTGCIDLKLMTEPIAHRGDSLPRNGGRSQFL
jgi:hypothetical protein